MYIADCSYILEDFNKPWRVNLVSGYSHIIYETNKFHNKDEVVNKLKEYLLTYGDKLMLVENVYWAPYMLPRLGELLND